MTIFKSAFIISFFTIISRISGFIRDMLVATIVGTGFYADVFFASFKLTNLLRKLLAEGSFFAAFIPSFSHIKEKYGHGEARIFAIKMFSITFYLLAIIIILGNLFMPQITKIMTPGFTAEKLDATISLSYIIIWYLLFVCLVSILSGILNGMQKFSYYAIVPILLNIVLIAFIVFFQDHFENIAHCLAYGVVCGGVVQFLFVYLACVYEKFTIYLQKPSKKLLDEHTKTSYKRMLPAILGGGLTQVNTMVDMILGSYIASGVSYLYYVDRIFYLPTSVIGTAIGIVILPFISKQIAQSNFEGATKVINEGIQLSIIFVLPAAFILFFLSEVVTSILFERGAFNATDVHFVSSMLKILAIGLPLCVLNKVTSAIFFSYSNTKTPMYITFFSVAINVAVSVSLMPFFGIYAIVSGTALSYFVSFGIGMFVLISQKKMIITKQMLAFLLKVTAMALCTGLVALFLCEHQAYGYNAMLRDSILLIKLLYLLLIGTICIGTYILTGFCLRLNIILAVFHNA
jgi:putative peptidoglycan lipid II flippase